MTSKTKEPRIIVTQVSEHEFSGYMYSDELTDEQLRTLGLDPNADFCTELKVRGPLSVAWGDEPGWVELEVLGLKIEHEKNSLLITGPYDYVNLCDEILNHQTADWGGWQNEYWADSAEHLEDVLEDR